MKRDHLKSEGLLLFGSFVYVSPLFVKYIKLLVLIIDTEFLSKTLYLLLNTASTQEDREHSGSVVEFLTRNPEAVGSSLTGVTVLLSLSKTHLS